jgi:hypothetical protein
LKCIKALGIDLLGAILNADGTHVYEPEYVKQNREDTGEGEGDERELSVRSTQRKSWFNPSTDKSSSSRTFFMPQRRQFQSVVKEEELEASDKEF